MSENKTVKDLTIKELLEDLAYYTNLTQMKCPKWIDSDFKIIWKYIEELKLRENKKKEIAEDFYNKGAKDTAKWRSTPDHVDFEETWKEYINKKETDEKL